MTTNADSLENFVQKMKLAVAVGCLRNKPAGASGREYAQQLCDRFQQGQLEWKERCQRAETELLHLKQQLAMQQADSSKHMEVDDDGTGSDILFPTPPSSGSHGNQNIPEYCHGNSVTNSLSKHTVFLHHVISLQTGSKSSSNRNLDSLAKKSIEHSLDIIQQHIGDTTILNRLQVQSIQSIDKLYPSCDCGLRDKILETVKLSAGKLIDGIISQEEYRTQDQTRHRELLHKLACSKTTNTPVIELLVDTIQKFSDTLRNVVSDKEETLDPNYFSSMYYIIDTLGQGLDSTTQETLSTKLTEKIQSKLEDCLLHITDQFPLFAHAVWRLLAKLSS